MVVVKQDTEIANTANVDITNNPLFPQVTPLSNGDKVFTWDDYGEDGSGWGIYQSVSDTDGDLVSAQRRVNTSVDGDQSLVVNAGLSGGGWISAWITSGSDSAHNGLAWQRYNSDGSPNGSEVIAITGATVASVGLHSDDRLVVMWQGSDGFMHLRAYNQNGTTAGPLFDYNVTSDTTFWAMPDGRYTAVWSAPGVDGKEVFQQLFNDDGTPNGTAQRVNTATVGNQSNPVITPLAGGNWLIQWSSSMDGDCHAQLYGSDGHAIGQETSLGAGATHYGIISTDDGGFMTLLFAPEGGAGHVQFHGADGSIGSLVNIAPTTPIGSAYTINNATVLNNGDVVVLYTDGNTAQFGVFHQDGTVVVPTTALAGSISHTISNSPAISLSRTGENSFTFTWLGSDDDPSTPLDFAS